MPWSAHETVAESKAFLDHAQERWDDGDRGKYVYWPGEGEEGVGEFAELIGLRVDWDRRTGTIWRWLREPFSGRGYADDGALTLVELAFSRLDLDLVAVTHAVENERSQRAIEKYVTAAGGQRNGLVRNWVPHGGRLCFRRGPLHRHTRPVAIGGRGRRVATPNENRRSLRAAMVE